MASGGVLQSAVYLKGLWFGFGLNGLLKNTKLSSTPNRRVNKKESNFIVSTMSCCKVVKNESNVLLNRLTFLTPILL